MVGLTAAVTPAILVAPSGAPPRTLSLARQPAEAVIETDESYSEVQKVRDDREKRPFLTAMLGCS